MMVLVLLAALSLPAFADDNSHQVAQVLEITQGAREEKVLYAYHLKEAQMMETVRAALETEEGQTLFPEDAQINHLSMIRQRDVVNNAEPIELSLRAWGAGDRYLVVLFKPLGEEEWTVVAVAQGEYIDAILPGDGQYALAWSWD